MWAYCYESLGIQLGQKLDPFYANELEIVKLIHKHGG